MKRWTQRAATALLLLASSSLAFAQGIVREAPVDVKPALMTVSATPPDIRINGEAARLSPGSRIRDTQNMMVLSGALAGRTVPVVYKRDPMGLVHEVWLLTPAEYEKVGGVNTGDPNGYKRFNELLSLIWAARTAIGVVR
ncbi:hypothetical protein [Ramlibacter sp.]|uniref:hypothetical protein n=1 Tax=Ramlibacter sp. TaxID=1917967 RepID=UPI003D0CCA8A